MRGCKLNEEKIRTALYADAYSYDPPTDLKQQIDARLAWQEKKEVITMKRISAKRVAIVAALACALTGTVCMAAGKVNTYVIGSELANETTDFGDVAGMEKKAGITSFAKEAFKNGFKFKSACTANIDGMDEDGNVAERNVQMSVFYEKGEKSLTYMVENKSLRLSEQELESAQLIELDGITYYFEQSDYLFVPEGYEPTEEELAAKEAGKLHISEGTEEREEMEYGSLYWQADGQTHYLSGYDLGMSGEELAEMAAELK